MGSEKNRIQPRKRPRQVRAELTRQRILTAAARVFTEYGYAAGTTNRIAERAGISIGSLYQYFPNKDAILAELITEHLEAGEAAMHLDLDSGTAAPLAEVVRRHVRVVIGNHLDDPHLLRIMMERAPGSDELMEKVARQDEVFVAYMRGLLDRHPEVRVADKHTAARLVVSIVELTVHRLIAEPDPIDPERLENELVALITGYLTASRTG